MSETVFKNKIKIRQKDRDVYVQILAMDEKFRTSRYETKRGFIISNAYAPRFGDGYDWNHLFYVIGKDKTQDRKISHKSFESEVEAKKFVKEFKLAFLEIENSIKGYDTESV